MGRKPNAETEGKRRGLRSWIPYALVSASFLAIVVGGAYSYHRVQQFLINNPRFRFTGPSQYGASSPNLRIEGIRYASRERVVGTFAADFGRSIYLLPLSERRLALRAIDWVQDAAITRLWPDRVAVQIIERTPAAFIQLPASRRATSFRMALIDAEGVILEPPPRAHFTLPVLTGIRREQSRASRRDRVGKALQLIRGAGKLANDISEIDVSDPGNLKITQNLDGRAATLMMGNRNFESRLQNFVNHYPEIHRRLEGASVFDLRLDDRITVVEEDGKGG